MEINEQRNHGIDLLKIVSMIMIITLHVMGNGGILAGAPVFSVRYCTAWFLEAVCMCAVNVYAIISGYLGYGRKFKFSNVIYLWFEVVFFCITISLIFYFAKPGMVSVTDILKGFLPITFNKYWYFTSYFCLSFFIPFLNAFMAKADKKTAWMIVITGFVVFSVIPTVCYRFTRDVFILNFGYSPLWLCVLYITGSCLKKCPPVKTGRIRCLVSFLIMSLISFGSKILIEYVSLKRTGESLHSNVLMEYNSPTMYLAAVSLVLLFVTFSPKKLKAPLKMTAGATFGVYIIHLHICVWMMYTSRFAFYTEYNAALMGLFIILTSLSVFVLCTAADIIRYYLFEILHIRKLSVWISEKIREAYMKCAEFLANRSV